MRIEHVALWVKDLEKQKEFYVKYFEGKANEKYYNPAERFQSYFIRFSEGSRLELMQVPELENKAEKEFITGFSHVAFSLGSKEKVENLTEILRKDGYRIVSEPRITGDGYFESCILDEEGNRIELTV